MNDNQNNIFSNFNQTPNNMPNQNQTPFAGFPAQNSVLQPSMPAVNESQAPSFEQFNNQSAMQVNQNPVAQEAPVSLQPEMPSVNTNPSPFDIGLNNQVVQNAPTQFNETNQTLNSDIPSNVSSFNESNTNMVNTQAAEQNTTSISVPVATVKQYLVHFILTCIPIVGFIILLVRAFGSSANKNISNLAKAQLLLSVIMVVLSFVLTFVFSALLVSLGIGLA